MKQWKLEALNHLKLMKCEKKYNTINPLSRIVPRLYDIWFCDEKNGNTTFYMLMEKYDGNLTDFIEKYRDNDLMKTIIRISLSNLASSIYFIHNNCNICINDIKLDNIFYKFVDGQYEFVFGDFGMSIINPTQECKNEDMRRFNNSVSSLLNSI